MVKYAINEELKGIEISFSAKPEKEILEGLKDLGFKWHKVKRLWYAKNTPDRLAFAEGLTEGKKIEFPDRKEDRQKELFSVYMEIVARDIWKNSPDMVEYERKTTQYIVELKSGDIIALDKPTIKTSFCFGYGYCGVTTQEDMDGAYNMMHHAETEESYFIKENLKGLNEYIESLRDKDLFCYAYTRNGQAEDGRLKNFTIARLCDTPEYAPYRFSALKDVKQLDMEDRERIAQGYEIVKAAFTKRLNAYLKRYGLSKLKTWTYLVD